MLAINDRNVNAIWHRAIGLILQEGRREKSRAGPVLVAPCPVMTIYQCPMERVLFDSVRDANPFFHFFESLWMLAGRNDAAFLNRFVRDFGERFAEPNGTLHGAYGRRWRKFVDSEWLDTDQLDVVVKKLRANPQDRQCVIQMWDANHNNDLQGNWRDRPCNTHVYLRVRPGVKAHYTERGGERVKDHEYDNWPFLDLTVLCRSNDIVWGAYGANAVHFSMLQEYLAGRIGVGVGKMYQLSNNWHAYVEVLEKYLQKRKTSGTYGSNDPYDRHTAAYPIGTEWEHWDNDLNEFLRWAESTPRPFWDYVNRWFHDVAQPMWLAHERYREGDHDEAMRYASNVQAPDWSRAAGEWLQRRKK